MRDPPAGMAPARRVSVPRSRVSYLEVAPPPLVVLEAGVFLVVLFLWFFLLLEVVVLELLVALPLAGGF